MKFLKWAGIVLLALTIFYLLGPSPAAPSLDTQLPPVAQDLKQLEKDIVVSERNTPHLKPDNQARIVWFDAKRKEKTPYSVVYLHGFTASQAEGAPVHRDFARRYGCNLYLARLDQHGLDDPDAFLEITPESLLASAKEALAIAQQLGDSTIVISTSTGSTLALYLAAEHPELAGLILYSPLIDFYDSYMMLLNKPWGLQIARLSVGSKYIERDKVTKLGEQYWANKYRLEGGVALKSLVAATMKPEVFQQVKQPVFLGYYYKDETHQDHTVSVEAMREMFTQLGTPDALKRQKAFPQAGEHVIASYITSGAVDEVKKATFRFAEEILKLSPIKVIPKQRVAVEE